MIDFAWTQGDRETMRYVLVIFAGMIFIGAALVKAQMDVWPHRLHMPQGEEWWFVVAAFAPLYAVPLTFFPRVAMPVLLSAGGLIIVGMIVLCQPDLDRIYICVAIYLVMCFALEPRLISLMLRLAGAFRRKRGPGKRDELPPEFPPEFSPALVPRTPKNPSPLVAHAVPDYTD